MLVGLNWAKNLICWKILLPRKRFYKAEFSDPCHFCCSNQSITHYQGRQHFSNKVNQLHHMHAAYEHMLLSYPPYYFLHPHPVCIMYNPYVSFRPMGTIYSIGFTSCAEIMCATCVFNLCNISC